MPLRKYHDILKLPFGCKLDALIILFPQTAHASANFQKYAQVFNKYLFGQTEALHHLQIVHKSFNFLN